ncbi:MAG: hypothetical protein AB1611_01460 [bacterium]
MTRLIRLVIITLILFGALCAFAGTAQSQWTVLPPAAVLPPVIASPFPDPFGYPGLLSLGLEGYGQAWPVSAIPYSSLAGLASPALTNLPPQSIYPNGVIPFAPSWQPANPVYGSGWNAPYLPSQGQAGIIPPYAVYGNPLPGYTNPAPPSVYYPPVSGYPSASSGYPPVSSGYPVQGGLIPGISYLPGSTLAPYPYSYYPDYSGYYNPAPSGQQSDPNTASSTSTSQDPPAQVGGVWIGTWTSSFNSQQNQTSGSASINLAQEGTAASGVFLFVDHPTINALSATGLIQGDQIQVSTVTGEGNSTLTISFEGKVKGDTWSGEYLIINKAGAAIEAGEFVVSRIW